MLSLKLISNFVIISSSLFDWFFDGKFDDENKLKLESHSLESLRKLMFNFAISISSMIFERYSNKQQQTVFSVQMTPTFEIGNSLCQSESFLCLTYTDSENRTNRYREQRKDEKLTQTRIHTSTQIKSSLPFARLHRKTLSALLYYIINDIFIMAENCCSGEINSLKKNLEEENIKSKELKQQYHQLLIENLQKDVTIRNLKKKFESFKYGNFKGILSDSCLDELKLFGDSQREDSSFIRCAIKDLYRENIDSLKQKTLSGRSKDDRKTKISPEKMSTLDRLFEQRISYMTKPEEIDDIRKKSLNKLIRRAIDNEK